MGFNRHGARLILSGCGSFVRFDAENRQSFARRLSCCFNALSVEMLVGGVKGREDNVEDLHLADRTVTNARWNVNALASSNRKQLAVELDLGLRACFENVIDLDVMVVMMRGGILFDLDLMQRERRLRNIGQCSSRPTARTADRLSSSQVDDGSSLSHQFFLQVVQKFWVESDGPLPIFLCLHYTA